MSSLLLVIIFIIVLSMGLFTKVNCYGCYIDGAKEGLKTTVNMFSYLLTFSIAVTLLNSSGILNFISELLNIKYVPIIIQMLIRPLSSSSSLSMMLDTYNSSGIDSKISIIATLINYVSDSTLYIVPFYCGVINIKRYNKIIFLGLIVNYFSYLLVIIVSLLIL